MRLLNLLSAAVMAPAVGLAAPAQEGALMARENLCSLKAPPALCTPNPATTVEETARRAYQFYKSFVVDGDPKLMFSLIDSVYTVSAAAAAHVSTGGMLIRDSNTTLATGAAPRTSGRCSAPAARLAARRARRGASTLPPTCLGRTTVTSTGGGGLTAASTSTYVFPTQECFLRSDPRSVGPRGEIPVQG